MYDRNQKCFLSYDSNSGYNMDASKAIATKVEPYLKGKLQLIVTYHSLNDITCV